jgi:hypothetical protein
MLPDINLSHCTNPYIAFESKPQRKSEPGHDVAPVGSSCKARKQWSSGASTTALHQNNHQMPNL